MSTITIHDAMFTPTTVESEHTGRVESSPTPRRRIDPAFAVGMVISTVFWIGGPAALWAMASLIG